MNTEVKTKKKLGAEETEILEYLKASMVNLTEASGIAESLWGKEDKRTRVIEAAWSEVYTIAHQYDPFV